MVFRFNEKLLVFNTDIKAAKEAAYLALVPLADDEAQGGVGSHCLDKIYKLHIRGLIPHQEQQH